jgi:predicted dehydrogenase
MSSTSTSTSTSTSSIKPIRVGIVGLGNWARHGHLRVLSLLPTYELTAIYSRRPDAARAVAEYGIKHVVGSLDGLVNHPEVDLVVVLNTAPQHAHTVRTAIAAGKNVYCEWPLTPSVETSRELVRLAAAADVRTVVGLQRRLAPHNRYLGDLLKQGYVGKLRSVRMHVSMNSFQAHRPIALAWTAPTENFSSAIAIYAGHFLDMLFTATGWPDSTVGVALNQFKQITITDTGEKIPTTNPDQLVVAGTIGSAVVSIHVEAGKRNGAGVQIDITGDEGDLRIVNTSAFGDIGDDYRILGTRGDAQPLIEMPVPATYARIPDSTLPSSVLELAELYAAYANDVATGSNTAPVFEDAVVLHHFLNDATRELRAA